MRAGVPHDKRPMSRAPRSGYWGVQKIDLQYPPDPAMRAGIPNDRRKMSRALRGSYRTCEAGDTASEVGSERHAPPGAPLPRGAAKKRADRLKAFSEPAV